MRALLSTILMAAACTHTTDLGGQPSSGAGGLSSASSGVAAGSATTSSLATTGGASTGSPGTASNAGASAIGAGSSGSSTGSGASTGGSTAAAPTPTVMIVQDLSGSMCEPIASGVALADGGPGAGDCAADPHQSKAFIAASAVTGVLGALEAQGFTPSLRLGLTVFPAQGTSAGACQAPAGAAIPVADLSSGAQSVATWYWQLQRRRDRGHRRGRRGHPRPRLTPAAAATDPLLANPDPNARKLVVLITDGLPNCNPQSPCVVNQLPWSDGVAHGCASPNARCRSSSQQVLPTPRRRRAACAHMAAAPIPAALPAACLQCCLIDPSFQSPGTEMDTYASEQCLDGDATVQAIANLYAQGISTDVIVLGSSFSVARHLHAHGVAAGGGWARRLPSTPARRPS